MADIDYQALLEEYGCCHWWIVGMRRITWAVLGPVRGRLLDVGCGPGWLLKELPVGVAGLGVDRHVAHLVSQDVAAADACWLPFPNAAFDIVTALDVLEQDEIAPARALGEIFRVLGPGGKLLVRAPAYPALYGPHDVLWGGARRYKREQLSALVQDAGFAIRRLTHANALLLLPGIISRLAARAGMADGNDVQPLSLAINRLLLGILTAEARWLVKHDFRAGLSLLCLAERRA